MLQLIRVVPPDRDDSPRPHATQSTFKEIARPEILDAGCFRVEPHSHQYSLFVPKRMPGRVVNWSSTIIWHLFAMTDDRSFTLCQADQVRGDLYDIQDELDLIK